MLTRRIITAEDIRRAAEINDSIAGEHGGDKTAAIHIGRELGLDVQSILSFSAGFAVGRVQSDLSQEEGQELVCMMLTMGALAALRSVRMIELEAS